MDVRAALAASALFPLLALAGCAAPACTVAPPAETPAAETPAAAAAEPAVCPVPAFGVDGRVRRDLDTEAPLFVARSGDIALRAPRFRPDGSVARDPESGAPLYEEVAAGCVVRVLVLLP
jgi:hypothetical protein